MTTKSKIKTLKELASAIDTIRAQCPSKKVVQCHGVFDLMHVGHIRHFEEAKSLGDLLIVTITPDQYVNKGLHRPAFPEDLRAETIAALDCVDYVSINKWPTAIEAIQLIKPDIYAKGPDYKAQDADITGKIREETKAVESTGGQVVITDGLTFSSSTLINRHLSTTTHGVREYLSDFTSRYSLNDVIDIMDRIKELKVLLVGEAIIDEYQFCQSIGKSAKEPILAAKYLSSERFAGGILAVANHVANFCDNVTMVSMVGAMNPEMDFINRGVSDDVEKILFQKENSPTITKRRFVESYLSQKIFEIYEINDDHLSEKQDSDLCNIFRKIVPDFDIVVVADYGHGMLTDNAIGILTEHSNMLAVNTQANAGNRGFNTISRYPRADFICLASHEIALEERNREGNYQDMTRNVSDRLECNRMIVTLGSKGSICFDMEEGFFEIPAFANQVVDRMGAGDAVLSLASLCIAQGSSIELAGFIGNLAGAQAVATMGHRSSIERVAFMKQIQALMK